KANDESPVTFTIRITALRERKQFVEIEKALKAYIRHRGAYATPWMYEVLATTLKINKRSVDEAKTALGWAAYLAKRDKLAMQATSVGDLMAKDGYESLTVDDGRGNKFTTSVGELFDVAMKEDPTSDVALRLSLKWAERTGDPERMGRTVERFLEIPWPGV